MAKQINPDLSDEQKHALFDRGTEAPWSGKYLNHNAKGVYTCVNCGAELFTSQNKYESNQLGLEGWPSFADVTTSNAVDIEDDNSWGMHRLEVSCKNCGAHLGHLFDDNSSPSGKHYCINSVCLGFKNQK